MSPCEHRPGKAHFCTCFLSEKHLELLNAPMKNNWLPAFEKMQRYLSLALLSMQPRCKWISPGRALTKAACHYTCINQVASKRHLNTLLPSRLHKIYKNYKITVSTLAVTWMLHQYWGCRCLQTNRILVRFGSVPFYLLNNTLLMITV